MQLSLFEMDRKYLWHPSTQMKDFETEDHVLITRADGIRLYDANGKAYYDTISSWWCNVHGHNHPKVKEAIKSQLDRFDHVLFAGLTHENAIRAAEMLVQVTPQRLCKVFFSDNGSTACEIALKMSYQYWKNSGKEQKQEFVALELGYHGDTIGAMSVGGTSLFDSPFSTLLFRAHKVPSPYCYRCRFGKSRDNCELDCIKPLEELLRARNGQIAGIILEPLVQGAGGMIIYPVEYLNEVGRLAREYGVHLIADEVAVGFGRTGKMFATEFSTAEPDFMCVSKGLTNGCLPLAATITTQEVYDAFYDDYEKNKTFYHGHTFTANPLATAAAVASLQVFQEEDTIEKSASKIACLHQEMERFRELPHVGDVRCKGMIAALELVRDKDTTEPFTFEERVGWRVYQEGLKTGIILRPLGNVNYLFLPLCITQDELADVLQLMHEVVSNTVQNLE
ncbi:MAG: adenosylmethionine--8-amino-7-oxononanoate transaminase [Chloroflexota bacterium]|nr:adenosylmethionine--8-amino-7-oxononanoate transaminase [Chloroflexota bacterium]